MQVRAPLVGEHDAPPGLAVTVYPVIVKPPLDVGAVHDTTLCPLAPLEAETLVGTLGGPDGVAALDALDALLVPARFVAVTVNVYAVAFVNPVTVQVRAPLVDEHDAPPGLAVTVYPVIAELPE